MSAVSREDRMGPVHQAPGLQAHILPMSLATA